MAVRTEFPFPVRVIPHEWIPMPDGCRLAARIWRPEGAERAPVPAIFEYVPYRKNDDLVLRDASMEQEDGAAVIRWLATRPWCSGQVGITGKSWGGFNGLQIAAHRPPEPGAVISVASTDDRYADDVRYMGGCRLAATALPWASTMLAYNALPPDPAVVGAGWRTTWRLIGVWAHDYPEDGAPGPAIGFLQEAVRWRDYWLKGQDNGVMDEPKLRAWLPEARRPAAGYLTHPGRWLAAGTWPAPEVETRSTRSSAVRQDARCGATWRPGPST